MKATLKSRGPLGKRIVPYLADESVKPQYIKAQQSVWGKKNPNPIENSIKYRAYHRIKW